MRERIIHAVLSIGVLGTALVIPETSARAQASGAGSIRGQLRDKADGNAAVGATVVATSPQLLGEQIVLADDTGLYFLTALPPGTYTLTVYYNDGTFTRGNVVVQVGKEAVVNIMVDSSSKGETIEITGTPPIIDQGSTKTGQTITTEFTNNVPGGRTFGAVIGAMSGSQQDFYGTSVAGATSAENVYVVDGINTTDTARGGLSSNLPNEFVQETEVIAGGYNAEYGRATGGIVNVVTKQGSNQFHGSVFAHYTPGQLSAASRTIQRAGNSIDSANNLDYNYDLGGELGGPIIKDKLWFHIGFNPTRVRNVTTRLVQSQVDDNQDGVPDVDPSTGFAIHKRVSSSEIPDATTTYYFSSKLSGEIDQNHQFQISVFGNPSTGDTRSAIAVGAPDNGLVDVKDGVYDFAGKYTSKFNNGQTQIDAVAGYHKETITQSPHNALGAAAGVRYNYTRSLFDFADLEGPSIAACQDGGSTDRYPKIRNCPVNRYVSQGQGLLEDQSDNRTSGLLSITQRVKALGYHVLKAGGDVQFATYDSHSFYTGDEFLLRSCNTDENGNNAADCNDPRALPGAWQILKYATVVRNLRPDEIADPGSVMLQPGQQIDGCAGGLAICGAVGQRAVQTTNRSIGAYVQDSWQIRPNVTLNAGLRFEQQVLYNASNVQGQITPTNEVIPKAAFTLDNWAPRVGAIYDPTSEGKSRVFAHWGRFYENVPNDINVRSFGAEIDDSQITNAHQLTALQSGYNSACNVNHQPGIDAAKILSGCTDLAPAALSGGGTEFVAPGIHGQYTDELVAGVEYEFLPDLKIGATYTHRTLPSVIEDMSSNNTNSYLIANPGANYDGEAAKLEAQAMAMMSSNKLLADALLERAQSLRFVKNFDAPSRNYDSFAVRVEQRPSRRSLLVASYTYSVERGNYPGLFSTETNQLDPNITSQYDLPELMANRFGPLGLDRPHNIKLDGFYQFDLKNLGIITLGSSVRAQSGIAHNALGSHRFYGPGESYLLPRGAVSRSPMTGNVDLHVSYGRRLDKDVTLEAFVRVFNLVNSQDELNVDENYTFSNANPVIGGDMNDLRHLKTVNADGSVRNQSPVLNSNFDHLNALTVPRSFQFGMRLTF